ncbi:MAG TPA: LysM domain-containing protein, partial [Limnochordales bacterium]
RGRQGLATAGVLLGQPLRDRQGTLFVVVDGAVEAPGVEVAARSVRFPPASWDAVVAAARACCPQRQVVGWFHARPGEPPDLSPYESFWHHTHFPEPWQVALVLDAAAERGWMWAWNDQTLDTLPGFYLHDAPVQACLPASQVEQAGWYPGTAAASSAGGDLSGSHLPGSAGRGQWAITPLQQRMRARAVPVPASPWWRVARMVRAVAVLAAVFLASAAARWVWDHSGPGRRAGVPAPAPAQNSLQGSGSSGVSTVLGGAPVSAPVPQAPAAGPGGQPAPLAAAADPGGAGAAGSAAQARAAAGMTGSPAPAQGAGQDETYSVQPGDTLWALAGRFYGEPSRARWLAEHNGIRDPNRIRVGQVIRLPSAGEKRPGGK